MQRCHIPGIPGAEDRIALPGDEARHLLRVLRVRDGERIEALDGRGGVFRGPLRAEGSRAAVLEIEEREQHPEPRPSLTLYQALATGEKMDWIVQKATELGARAVRPVLAERSVARPEGERGVRKQEHWQRVAANALKQCGNPWLPEVGPVRPLAACLDELGGYEACLVGAPESDLALRAAVAGIRERGVGRVACLVGPEGGFSAAELERIAQAGAQKVRLAPAILRTETAAIYFLSVLAYELFPS